LKPVPDDVRSLIAQWAQDNKGHVYAPVLHPEFSDLPYQHGPDRFDIIRPFLGHEGGTVLDIGTHWGYMAHRLEQLGYDVTAVEHADHIYRVAEGLRDACEMKFKVIHSSIFDVKNLKFDIVIALNIFHHFLKKKDRYDAFLKFLSRLDCKTMIFQSHKFEEPQMRGAYTNMEPDAFAEFIAKHAGLRKVESIGDYGRRQIYRLSRS
jgi:cyclopropane fatty-acyl-phospholipid synthase-like methyltransferase